MSTAVALFAILANHGTLREAAPHLSDTDLFACVLFAESYDYDGSRWVADVVKNRVRDARWPDTVREVIEQPHQFSVMDSPAALDRILHAQRKFAEGVRFVRTHELAQDVLYAVKHSDVARRFNPSNGATHFECTACDVPYWAVHMEPTGQAGGNTFYKDGEA